MDLLTRFSFSKLFLQFSFAYCSPAFPSVIPLKQHYLKSWVALSCWLLWSVLSSHLTLPTACDCRLLSLLLEILPYSGFQDCVLDFPWPQTHLVEFWILFALVAENSILSSHVSNFTFLSNNFFESCLSSHFWGLPQLKFQVWTSFLSQDSCIQNTLMD